MSKKTGFWSLRAILLLAVWGTQGAFAASPQVDFEKDVLPILARRCAICHSDERQEGEFNLATREHILLGGSSGEAAVPGDGKTSLLLQVVEGAEDVSLMPAKGPQLTAQQVDVLRRWIDQGMPWTKGLVLTPAMGVASLELHKPQLPERPSPAAENPIDVLLGEYYASHGITPGEIVSDRVFARRLYLDLVGLLPSPEQLASFEQSTERDKRAQLVDQLLADRTNYALHWMTFWNDALRNSYRGTGFIDNNRTQITAWLFAALYDNIPYDQFVR
jgi:mono/diheme cytochrome c family protein